MSKPLVICLMPVKNEDWILQKTLTALSLFCDKIIIGDAGSSDKTPEIIAKFAKAIHLHNSDESMVSGRNRRQLMLDKAREFGPNNIILCFDADEIPTANILGNVRFWEKLNNLIPGQSLKLEWITLWKSPSAYRTDQSIWSGQYRLFGFRDDGVTNFAPGDVHEWKVPAGFEQPEHIVTESEVKVMHFHFVLWNRMLSKQAHCRIKEFTGFKRSPFFINFRYGVTKEEHNLATTSVPGNWLSEYQNQGIQFGDIAGRDLYWYDIEILEDFAERGAEYYRWLDIWDIDWEKKRLIGRKLNYKNIPFSPIIDPRSGIIKLYHYLLRYVNIQFLTKWYGRILQLAHGKA